MATTTICGAVVSALAIASAAQAQTAAPAADAPTEVIITGSRISGITNVKSASPISTFTRLQIEQTKSATVEDVLARMVGPDFNGISIASNNGGVGDSTVSMRNLGPSRTLVLLDGTRLIPNGGTVDLNIIPLSMVERVEVLRDGASSVYGADAIGGVVNIITKKSQDGMTLDASYGQTGKGDGTTYSTAISAGLNTDRGNVMIAASWDHRDPIWGADRDWATDVHANDPNFEGGSVYRTQLNVLQDENASSHVWVNGAFYNTSLPGVAKTVAGILGPYAGYLPGANKVKLNADGPGWDALTGMLDRKQLSFTAHYDIADNFRFVADGFFTDRTSEQFLRPEPLLGDTIATFTDDGTTIFPGFIVPADAPGNTTGGDITAYLTPNQFGPRDYQQDSKTYRARLGFEGKLYDKYKWEAGYVYQSNSEDLAIANSGNWNHIAQLTEQTPCIDAPGGCTAGKPNVQPNWFGGPDNIFTPAQLAYVKYTRHDTQNQSEKYFYGNFSGPLFTLPAGEVKFSVGAESRQEHYDQTPDELTVEGWTANKTNPTSGGYDVNSVFGELYIPLLANLPLVKSLDLTPSYRHDDYSTFGKADTYKLGVNWSITDSVRFRASYSTGFRAPNVVELFGGTFVSDNGASGDPCEAHASAGNTNVGQGVLTAGSTCSLAVAGGAAVTTFHDPLNDVPGSQIQTLEGGNPNLQPEKSVSYSAGLVFTPTPTPGLSFEVDYYRIKVNNAILTGGIAGNNGNDFILLGCYGAQQNKSFCADVVRNSAGVITQINSLNDNAGSNLVDGLEYEISYDTRLAGLTLPIPGSFKFDFQASQSLTNTQQNIDGSVSDYKGKYNYNNETIYPVWQDVLNIDYRLSKWNFHWDTRYTQAMSDFNGGDHVYGNFVPNQYISSFSATYYLDKLGLAQHPKFTIGVDNLFDKDPPFLGTDSICKCNTLAGPFDMVGRYFYTRLSVDF